jgi:hypothetical protein
MGTSAGRDCRDKNRRRTMAKDQEKSAGHQMLTEILSDAVANGADAVELEYDSGHSLHVIFMSGTSGAGFILKREPAGELIDSLWQEKRKSRGKFRITLHGKDYMVQVKTRDHFGENAYRLTFREAKR